MSTFFPLASEPWASLPYELDRSTSPIFSRIFENPDRPILFLVEAFPYSPALEEVHPGLPGPLGSTPWASEITFVSYGGEAVQRFSDRGWRSRPDDPALPNANFPARIAGRGFVLSAEMFSGLDIAAGGNSRGSEIDVLYDTDDASARGEAALWARMGWDGRRVRVLAGLPEFHYEDFGVVADWTAAAIGMEEGRVSILPRDRSELFERELQAVLFEGTGGAEGHAGLRGTPKPLGYGRVGNASPVLLDQVNWLYQLHDGEIEEVIAVRDRGVALDFEADYPDFAALVDASIPGGRYATCRAAGYLRLGAEPAGGVTCDFRGDAAGGYVETCGSILRRIVTTRLGARSLNDPEDIDAVAFAALEAAFPAPIGFYEASSTRVSDVLLRIEQSFVGRSFFTRDGRLSVKRFRRPATTKYQVTDRNAGEGGLSLLAAPPPPWRVRVGYGFNHTLQGPSDLAGEAQAVAGALELYGNAWRYATAENAGVRARNRLSATREWPTLLAEAADAETIADVMIGFSDPPLRRIALPVLSALLRIWIGDDVKLEMQGPGIPAGGLSGVVVAISEDYAAGVTAIEVVG